jgi:hypothetical protein
MIIGPPPKFHGLRDILLAKCGRLIQRARPGRVFGYLITQRS